MLEFGVYMRKGLQLEEGVRLGFGSRCFQLGRVNIGVGEIQEGIGKWLQLVIDQGEYRKFLIGGELSGGEVVVGDDSWNVQLLLLRYFFQVGVKIGDFEQDFENEIGFLIGVSEKFGFWN